MTRGRAAALVAVLAMIGLLLWSTLGAQREECRVCVDWQGQHNCATASAASRTEAARSAQSTACGPVALGMDASIACSNRPPASLHCASRR